MLLGAPNLVKIGPIDMVILGWSCQGFSQVDRKQGLANPKSRLFWDLISIIHYLQATHMHQCAHLLENVPPLGDYRLTMLARWQQI